MRISLQNAIKQAVCIEMKLPNATASINKTDISNVKDVCFKTLDTGILAKVIYNGIVEYAVNEFEIDYDNLELEQSKVLARRVRYNPDADDKTKLKYGFYGEVLLDLFLRSFLKTDVLLARGYFYSPLEKAEPKGFDAFHLYERNEDDSKITVLR